MKLLDQLSERLRVMHYAFRTEQASLMRCVRERSRKVGCSDLHHDCRLCVKSTERMFASSWCGALRLSQPACWVRCRRSSADFTAFGRGAAPRSSFTTFAHKRDGQRREVDAISYSLHPTFGKRYRAHCTLLGTNASEPRAKPTTPPCDASYNDGSKSSIACAKTACPTTKSTTKPTSKHGTKKQSQQAQVDIHSPECLPNGTDLAPGDRCQGQAALGRGVWQFVHGGVINAA